MRFVQAEHPSAALPGLFADEELFQDALELLEELGEAKFSAPMNASSAGEGDGAAGWGELAAAESWDRARFDAAR